MMLCNGRGDVECNCKRRDVFVCIYGNSAIIASREFVPRIIDGKIFRCEVMRAFQSNRKTIQHGARYPSVLLTVKKSVGSNIVYM